MSTDQTIRQVPPGILEQLRALDACTVSNAIERLDVRLRNEGFTDISMRCLSPGLPPMVGYAVTGRIPAPRVTLGCIGYITNGAVRDLTRIGRTGFHLYAGGIAVSHAYAHVVDCQPGHFSMEKLRAQIERTRHASK